MAFTLIAHHITAPSNFGLRAPTRLCTQYRLTVDGYEHLQRVLLKTDSVLEQLATSTVTVQAEVMDLQDEVRKAGAKVDLELAAAKSHHQRCWWKRLLLLSPTRSDMPTSVTLSTLQSDASVAQARLDVLYHATTYFKHVRNELCAENVDLNMYQLRRETCDAKPLLFAAMQVNDLSFLEGMS